MPDGLLSTADRNFFSFKFAAACFAELVGTMIFAFFGGGLVSTDAQEVAWLNGLALAVLIYVTANISGGHLNPAVTLPTILTGHTGLFKGCVYVVMQLSGSALASLLLAGLYPGASVSNKELGVGCFGFREVPTGHLSRGMAFGWEAIMTFTLVATVYSVALGTPNFGNVGPLIIGLVQAAAAMLSSDKTGAAINPARALGPTFVFQCDWSVVWVYVPGGASRRFYCWYSVMAAIWIRRSVWPAWAEDHEAPEAAEAQAEAEAASWRAPCKWTRASPWAQAHRHVRPLTSQQATGDHVRFEGERSKASS
ncbi:hypothetical protein WJX84_007444 [Apatococcus fuscideae]|uniref:Aquaporin n=1 Tax=Apatococcus fuscideae TaxID=2026836 RepID=A0AAW1SYA0_9CHLO